MNSKRFRGSPGQRAHCSGALSCCRLTDGLRTGGNGEGGTDLECAPKQDTPTLHGPCCATLTIRMSCRTPRGKSRGGSLPCRAEHSGLRSAKPSRTNVSVRNKRCQVRWACSRAAPTAVGSADSSGARVYGGTSACCSSLSPGYGGRQHQNAVNRASGRSGSQPVSPIGLPDTGGQPPFPELLGGRRTNAATAKASREVQQILRPCVRVRGAAHACQAKFLQSAGCPASLHDLQDLLPRWGRQEVPES
jgi:hypothetical protein